MNYIDKSILATGSMDFAYQSTPTGEFILIVVDTTNPHQPQPPNKGNGYIRELTISLKPTKNGGFNVGNVPKKQRNPTQFTSAPVKEEIGDDNMDSDRETKPDSAQNRGLMIIEVAKSLGLKATMYSENIKIVFKEK